MARMIDLGLNLGGAISSVLAAYFWLQSASVTLPKEDKSYEGNFEMPGRITKAVAESARLNRLAASFSAWVGAFRFGSYLAYRER